MLPLDLLQIFKPLLWVIPIIVLIGIAKSPWFKGIIGEALVKLVAKKATGKKKNKQKRH